MAQQTPWDERYDRDGYVYGTSPNEFLVEAEPQLPRGRVLSIGDGEGRNGVYLATRGLTVVSIDSSKVGLAKAQKLAAAQGVSITTIHADLGDYAFDTEPWDGMVSIFCHLPSAVRKVVYRKVVRGLRPGGILVLESYSPDQLKYNTGGPQNRDALLSLDEAKAELKGLTFLKGEEKVRNVVEGDFHTGEAAVLQVIARKD